MLVGVDIDRRPPDDARPGGVDDDDLALGAEVPEAAVGREVEARERAGGHATDRPRTEIDDRQRLARPAGVEAGDEDLVRAADQDVRPPRTDAERALDGGGRQVDGEQLAAVGGDHPGRGAVDRDPDRAVAVEGDARRGERGK